MAEWLVILAALVVVLVVFLLQSGSKIFLKRQLNAISPRKPASWHPKA